MNTYCEIKLFDPETSTTAYIVIDCLVGGLAAGGIRMSPYVTIDEIRSLAEMMTRKHSVMGIPLGGAKIGIVGDPESKDKRTKIEAFAKMAEPILRSILLVGEDMGITSADVKAVYHSIQFDPSTLVIEKLRKKGIEISFPHGKTLDDLLSKNFMDYLVGFGILEAIDEAAGVLHIDLQSAKAAIQGFGTVGQGIARLLADKGTKICALSDLEGTVYKENGFEISEIEKAMTENGIINRDMLENYILLDRQDIFSLPVDIIIPASVAHVITKENAASISAKLIVEGANMPTMKEADEILSQNQITILPDFVVNAGSATGFGLLITGQAGFEDVLLECSKRIRQTVKTLLLESNKNEKTTREHAEELAARNMQKIIQEERDQKTFIES